MLISGIRNKIISEVDARNSGSFKRYLIYYLQMFALLGIIIPALIAVDNLFEPYTNEEVVKNKFYLKSHTKLDYYIQTENHRFRSDIAFYENSDIGDTIAICNTPIFDVSTNVSKVKDNVVYTCNIDSVYGFLLIIAGIIFFLSIFIFIKIWRNKHNVQKYDQIINIGIVNAILCIIIVVAVLFQKLY